MSSSYFSLFDMAIAGIPVVAFCIWQLVSINREIAKDKATKDAASRHPREGGHP